jgi:hypothetical protein
MFFLRGIASKKKKCDKNCTNQKCHEEAKIEDSTYAFVEIRRNVISLKCQQNATNCSAKPITKGKFPVSRMSS